KFGADSLRVFEMFLGPLQDAKPWSEKGIEGVNRFLNRVWRMIADDERKISPIVQNVQLTTEQEFVLHSTIKKVAEDIENLHFNTAIAQMMIFVNEFTKADIKPREAMEKFVLCLAPFAPHIGEELWHILGHKESVVIQPFPDWNEAKTIKNEVELVIQVNSKIRGKLVMPIDTIQSEAEAAALSDGNVQKFSEGKSIKKIIFIKNKLINIIAG
ncbi:MAG: leucyl-tRNA synthetase, partial [Bacteroidota bacterium]|nr:leucyl-tRNA synthetase [Bacteroidota bacterium]